MQQKRKVVLSIELAFIDLVWVLIAPDIGRLQRHDEHQRKRADSDDALAEEPSERAPFLPVQLVEIYVRVFWLDDVATGSKPDAKQSVKGLPLLF